MKKILLLMTVLVAGLQAWAQTTITMTTSKAVGEQISVMLRFTGDVTVTGATGTVTSGDYLSLTLTDQTVKIVGDISQLSCRGDDLTALTVSSTVLENLECGGNQLTTLDVSSCTALTTLYCYNNQLTALQLPNTLTLTFVDCSWNLIEGSAMDDLIASLPDHSSDGASAAFRVIDNSVTRTDNHMTTAQVAAAKAKGWTPSDSWNSEEYTGDDDPVAITPEKEYVSYVATSALDFSTVEGLEAYVVSAVDASKVTLTKVTEVPKHTGVILKKTGTATTYNVPRGTATTLSSTNLLKAAIYGTSVAANEVYVLSNGKFCLFAASGSIPGGHAYLPASEVPAGSNELSFDLDDSTTGIQRLTPILSEGDGVYYDLSGRRVQAPKKGLYIMNGKKYIIK